LSLIFPGAVSSEDGCTQLKVSIVIPTAAPILLMIGQALVLQNVTTLLLRFIRRRAS
jgi:hypothetical protein